MLNTTHSIVAPATPSGRGGIGILRISGPLVATITEKVFSKTLIPRYATYGEFLINNKCIDKGIAIYYCAPNSFTGEDVLELLCHGGPVILDQLQKYILELGATIARPGEFISRAFNNNKIDLVQAEAIADLINADSEQAVRNAVRTLQGEFSQAIEKLLALLIALRAQIEAVIDFSEEDLETIGNSKIQTDLQKLLGAIQNIKNIAKQGAILRDGITVVIAGKPNAGKSSLLNCLSGQDAAIVTAIPGTTRDVLHSKIIIDGMPLHLLDTAGLHASPDEIEQEGIKRAKKAMQGADHVLLIIDANVEAERDPEKLAAEFFPLIAAGAKLTVIFNKVDLTNEKPVIVNQNAHGIITIFLSVKKNNGIDLLKQHLKHSAGLQSVENGFSARRRHLVALDSAEQFIKNAQAMLVQGSIELIADDLTQAQRALGEITGEFVADDLLDKIFSEFCIGK